MHDVVLGMVEVYMDVCVHDVVLRVGISAHFDVVIWATSLLVFAFVCGFVWIIRPKSLFGR